MLYQIHHIILYLSQFSTLTQLILIYLVQNVFSICVCLFQSSVTRAV